MSGSECSIAWRAKPDLGDLASLMDNIVFVLYYPCFTTALLLGLCVCVCMGVYAFKGTKVIMKCAVSRDL